MAYSYNNIIHKREPRGKEELEGIILSPEEFGTTMSSSSCSSRPSISTAWRYDDKCHHPSPTTDEPSSKSRRSTTHDADVAHPIATTSSSQEVRDDDVIMVDHFLTAAECAETIAACERLGFTFWADPNTSTTSGGDEGVDDDATVTAIKEGAGMELEPTQTHDDRFRSAYTVEVHLASMADRLWQRLQPVALSQIGRKTFSPNMDDADMRYERDMEGTWEPVGVCDNILFARYGAGGHFAPHVDGSNIIDLNTRTLYTVLVYLNDCMEGGETFVLAGEQCDALHRDDVSGRYHSKPSVRLGAVQPRIGRAAVFYYNVLHEGSPVAEGGHIKYILRADVLYRRNPPILTEPNDIKAFEMYQQARVLEADGYAGEAVKKFQAVKKLSRGVAELYQLC